ncbi:MAG: hypothetical protein K2H39_07910 [Paramuribaculum sp.]|nr:hypothetical protein [Paramuribaculum sp.]
MNFTHVANVRFFVDFYGRLSEAPSLLLGLVPTLAAARHRVGVSTTAASPEAADCYFGDGCRWT